MRTVRECSAEALVAVYLADTEADHDFVLGLVGLLDEMAVREVPSHAAGRLHALRGNDEFERVMQVIHSGLDRLAASGPRFEHLRQAALKQVDLGLHLLVLKLKSGEAVFEGHAAPACAAAKEESTL